MKASKHSILLVGVLGVLLGISAGGRALLDQDDPPSVEQLLEQSRPGPVHERLGRLAGDWEVIRRYAAQGANETIGEGRASTPRLFVEISHRAEHVTMDGIIEISGRDDGHHIDDRVSVDEQGTQHSLFQIGAVQRASHRRKKEKTEEELDH